MATTAPAMPKKVMIKVVRGQPAAAGGAHDAAVGGDAVQEPDQPDGDDAVEHRGEDQGLDRVDADEVQAEANQHGGAQKP